MEELQPVFCMACGAQTMKIEGEKGICESCGTKYQLKEGKDKIKEVNIQFDVPYHIPIRKKLSAAGYIMGRIFDDDEYNYDDPRKVYFTERVSHWVWEESWWIGTKASLTVIQDHGFWLFKTTEKVVLDAVQPLFKIDCQDDHPIITLYGEELIDEAKKVAKLINEAGYSVEIKLRNISSPLQNIIRLK